MPSWRGQPNFVTVLLSNAAGRPDCSCAALSSQGSKSVNVLNKLHESQSPALRLLVGALLLTLVFAGAVAVTSHKTVTLTVDGTELTVATMKSRVTGRVHERQRLSVLSWSA